MQISRRNFLALVGAVAAASGLPREAVARELSAAAGDPATLAARAAELTTLAQTYGPGTPGEKGYTPVVTKAGESHVVRSELASPQTGRELRRATLVNLVHLTDQHVIDCQSPSRVEFLDRYNDGDRGCDSMPFASAHRPHEAASARITDAMLRRLRAIGYSPVTGAPLEATISTGDNTDNQQFNELMLFLGLMDGGEVTPNSGDETRYEGVQDSGDHDYWHPDASVADFYKSGFGYPAAPGFLESALTTFTAVGAGTPWYTCFGNHDGLAQGNAPVNPAFERIGTGGTKVVGVPHGTNPCNDFLGALTAPNAPQQPTTADPDRRYVSRKEWIQRHLESRGLPGGHGLTQANLAAETLYYTAGVGTVRWIVLDTVNPGGEASGSVGDRQLQWLEAELVKAQADKQLVMLFSHHGLRSLDNPVETPDPLQPNANDLPRRKAEDVLAVVTKYSCVIAWVNGHTHDNVIVARPTFWDIGTAAHIDWPPQSRLVEVVDNGDGTLSIFTTMVDHEDDDITAFARELMANDPQVGFGAGDGDEQDRNAELLIDHPFPETSAAAGRGSSVFGRSHRPMTVRRESKMGLTIGGALAVVTAKRVVDLRDRSATGAG
ncbi:MAG: TIGR03767 family metallophosphoesterase [Actinobacteria bacterium]|nr:TIGR03767 family metallophosphoesterase [Actinomycetota bacterium]